MNFIFDLGAVVFRWEPRALLARELPHHAGTPAAADRLFDSFFLDYEGEWGEFDRGTIEIDAMVRGIAARTGLTPAEVRRAVDAVPGALEPLEATVAWMRELKGAGHRLFYLSNMPEPIAAHLVRSHALFELFDDGVFSSHVKLVKPDAAIFRRALRQFGVPASECIFLDDRAANVEAARAQGWRGIVFIDAAQAQNELRALNWL